MNRATAQIVISVTLLWAASSLGEDSTEGLLQRAKAGNPVAQVNAGYMYMLGRRGIKRDLPTAVSWFRKAAEQGNANGQFELGVMYEHGWGVNADALEAASWYRKAGRQDHRGAELKLGNFYYDGNGVEQDYAKALYWYKKAAAHRRVEADYRLGEMYQEGLGVAKNKVVAQMWFRKAAALGNEKAQEALLAMKKR
jgi:uncharacterized protein